MLLARKSATHTHTLPSSTVTGHSLRHPPPRPPLPPHLRPFIQPANVCSQTDRAELSRLHHLEDRWRGRLRAIRLHRSALRATRTTAWRWHDDGRWLKYYLVPSPAEAIDAEPSPPLPPLLLPHLRGVGRARTTGEGDSRPPPLLAPLRPAKRKAGEGGGGGTRGCGEKLGDCS